MSEHPPLDAPDGILRTCPAHRVTPAPGPCGRCGDWRRAVEAVEVQATIDAAQRAEDARQAARRARELADREADTCGLCDDEGTATVFLAEGDAVIEATTRCLHDDGRNRRAATERRQLRANLSKRAQQPATYGAKV